MIKKYNLKDSIPYGTFPFIIYKTKVETAFDEHTHDFSELVMVLSGSAKHLLGKKEHTIKSGDIFLINGETSHGFKEADNLEICNIEYDPEKILTLSDHFKKLPGFQALFILEPFYRKANSPISKLELNEEQMQYVRYLIDIMIKEYTQKQSGFELVVHSHFIELVVYLSRQYVQYHGEMKNIMRLAEVMAYIESNFCEPIRLETLASRACLSLRQFIRVFKQSYHDTPANYILQLRLKHACSMLRNQMLSITEVATSTGFYDSNYFIRQFKKTYGVTPGEYRKRILKEALLNP